MTLRHSAAEGALRMSHNPYLHGLRGALALGVFFFHVVQSQLPAFDSTVARAVYFVGESLQYGVEIFFGISGIVIVYSFKKSTSVGAFLLNRVLRIAPVLWVTVGVIAALVSFHPRHAQPISVMMLVANLLPLPPIFSFKALHPAAWSIRYEVALYLALAAFSVLSTRVSRSFAVAVMGILAGLFMLTHLRAVPFLIGISIALVSLSGNGFARARVGRGAFKFAGCFLLASMLLWNACYILVPQRSENILLVAEDPMAFTFYILAFACASIGLLGVFYGQGAFSNWLTHPVMQWLGAISFSFYLWQTIVMALIKAGLIASGLVGILGPWSQPIFAVVALPLSLAVSVLSFKYIEGTLTQKLRYWLRGVAPLSVTQISKTH